MFKGIDASTTIERSPSCLAVMQNLIFPIKESSRYSKDVWISRSLELYTKLAMVAGGIRKVGVAT